MKNYCILQQCGETRCDRDFKTNTFCKHCAWNAEEDERRRKDIKEKGLKSKYSLWKFK